MSQRRRVLLADDHPPTRGQVRAVLEAHGFEVCAQVGDASMARQKAVSEQPDICLLDIHMPGSGIAACAEITARLPDVAVVMLTVSRNDEDLFDALRVGASGYLLKGGDPAELPRALEAVLLGEPVLGTGLLGKVIEEFRERGQRRRLSLGGGRTVQLTSREWETLELLRQGMSTREIAQRLFIAPVTVRTHIAAILKKLQVRSRQEAVRLLTARKR